MWKRLPIYFAFALLGHSPILSQVKILIDESPSIKYVDENLRISWNSSTPVFADLFWKRNTASDWKKIQRLAPNSSEYNWTIPYIAEPIIDLKIEATIPEELINIWDNLSAHSGEVRSAFFSPDMKSIISATEFEAKIWDFQNKTLLKTVDLSALGRARNVVPYHSVDTLIVSTINSIYLLEVSSGKFIDIGKDLISGVVRMAKVHPYLPVIAFGGDQGKVVLYDIYEMKPAKIFEIDTDNSAQSEIYSLSFSGSGDSLICGTYGGYLFLINWTKEIPILKFGRHGDEFGQNTPIFDVSISPKGDIALSCGTDKTVRTWNLATLEEAQIYNAHTFHVRSADLRTNGDQFVSCSLDSSLIFWDTETAFPISRIDYNASVVNSEVSRDNRFLIASGRDGSFKVWKFGEPINFSDSISFESGYKFDVTLGDVSGKPGELIEIPVSISHEYDYNLMPVYDYAINIYATYPKEFLTWENEQTAGVFISSLLGNVRTGAENNLQVKLLQGFSSKAVFSTDSVTTINPLLYHFFGTQSKLNLEQICYGLSQRTVIVDENSKMKIILNNKTLNIDVYFVEDGHYCLNLFDMNGNIIEKFVNEEFLHGNYSFVKELNGLPNGIYIVGFQSPSYESVFEKFAITN